jgi:hypothetical protein
MTVHPEVARSPDSGRANVAQKDGVVRGESIDYLGDILWVNAKAEPAP